MTDQIAEKRPGYGKTVNLGEPVTREDFLRLENLIKESKDQKYNCPFNDQLVLLQEHDKKNTVAIGEHDADINGNGKIGMKESIRILMKERDDRIKLQWIIITAFVGQFLILYFKQ